MSVSPDRSSFIGKYPISSAIIAKGGAAFAGCGLAIMADTEDPRKMEVGASTNIRRRKSFRDEVASAFGDGGVHAAAERI